MSDELKPCPFCGGDAIIQEPKVVGGLVRGGFLGCSSLHECFTPHLRFDVRAGERESAIAKWNRRTPAKSRAGFMTKAEIMAGRTPKGGWTRKTLEGWGVEWPPRKGWKQRLMGIHAQPQKDDDDDGAVIE